MHGKTRGHPQFNQQAGRFNQDTSCTQEVQQQNQTELMCPASSLHVKLEEQETEGKAKFTLAKCHLDKLEFKFDTMTNSSEEQIHSLDEKLSLLGCWWNEHELEHAETTNSLKVQMQGLRNVVGRRLKSKHSSESIVFCHETR